MDNSSARLTREDIIHQNITDGADGLTTIRQNLDEVSVDMCNDIRLPDIYSYISALNCYAPAIFFLGSLAVLIVFAMYFDTLKNIITNAPSTAKSREIFLITLYPVVSITTFLALVVPRSQMLVERVTQGMFVFAMYDLFCLYIGYCGGETKLITDLYAPLWDQTWNNKRNIIFFSVTLLLYFQLGIIIFFFVQSKGGARPSALDPRVGPCCCFPCCILPLLAVNKRNLMFLRISIIQLPIIQCFAYLGFLVMWLENEDIYKINYLYLQILVELSILVATWAILIVINMLKDDLRLQAIQSKFLTLQLPFLACKLQWGFPGLLVLLGVMPCQLPLTPTVFSNLIYNTMMLLEMIGFCYWARKLFKRDFLQPVDIERRNSLPAILSEGTRSTTDVGKYSEKGNTES